MTYRKPKGPGSIHGWSPKLVAPEKKLPLVVRLIPWAFPAGVIMASIAAIIWHHL